MLIVEPWAGPPVMVAVGAVVSAAKLLNTGSAGFGLRLYFTSPAVWQKLHEACELFGSRQWYHINRWMFQPLRLLRIIL